MERNGIRFELEELKNGPNAEPFMMELIHQVYDIENTYMYVCTVEPL